MKLLHWLIVIGVCVLVTAGLGWLKYRQIQEAIAFGASFPETVEAVEAYTVVAGTWQRRSRVPADVVAVRAVDVRTELEGRIVEVGFAPGEAVAAGQLLIRLDVSEERAQLAAARAEQEIARLALERAQQLLDSGAGTTENRDVARARHDAAIAMADRMQAVIDKRTLRAPFAGRTGLHTFEPGQYLQAGTLVTSLVDASDALWLDFPLPQTEAGLAIGTTLNWSAAGFEGEAEVVARDSVASATSRNVRFRALVEAAAEGLVPGMIATVDVPVGPSRTVALVPSVAVRRDTFGASVYVLEPAEEGAIAPERARRRGVELGPERDGTTFVIAGLEAGERIAATGAFKLREGVLVGARVPGTRPADLAAEGGP